MSEFPESDIERIALAAESPDRDNQKLAEAYSELAEDDERAQDNRGEERFIWIVICLILFDCLVLGDMKNWAAPIVIGIIELVLIIALAKKLRVEEIAGLLTRFMDRVGDYPDKRSQND